VGFVLAAVGFVWLVLVTLGLIGVNVRISIVRRDLMMATGRLPAAGGATTSARGTGLAAGTVVLVVSETCVTCSEAIDALRRAVVDGGLADRQVYVLSPDADDPRVTAPLALLSDDDLYRQLYGRKTPELIEIGTDGEPAHRFPVHDGDELRDHLRRLDVPSSLPA
jgi:hypothetical protein